MGLRGVPTICDRQNQFQPLLGDQCLRWLSSLLVNRVKPQTLSSDNEFGTPIVANTLFNMGGGVGNVGSGANILFSALDSTSDMNSIGASSIYDPLLNGYSITGSRDISLDPVNPTATVKSQKDAVNRNFDIVNKNYQQFRDLTPPSSSFPQQPQQQHQQQQQQFGRQY